MAGAKTFTSPPAQERLKKLIAYVKANDGVTQLEAVDLIGLSPERVGEYLRFAGDVMGEIHRLPREARTGSSGTVSLKWAGGPAPDFEPVEVPDLPVDRRMVKTWSGPVARDVMVAAFFGPARA